MTARRALAHQLRPTLAAAGAVTLTAFALSPTLADGPWFTATLLVIATVAVVGGAGRAFSIPGWAVVALQGLALLLLITVLFAGDVCSVRVPSRHRGVADVRRSRQCRWRRGRAGGGAGHGHRGSAVPRCRRRGTDRLVRRRGRRHRTSSHPCRCPSARPLPGPGHCAARRRAVAALRRGRCRVAAAAARGRSPRALAVGQADRRGHRRHACTRSAAPGRRLGAAALTVAVIVPVILPSLDDGRFGGGGAGDGSGGSGSGDARPASSGC